MLEDLSKSGLEWADYLLGRQGYNLLEEELFPVHYYGKPIAMVAGAFILYKMIAYFRKRFSESDSKAEKEKLAKEMIKTAEAAVQQDPAIQHDKSLEKKMNIIKSAIRKDDDLGDKVKDRLLDRVNDLIERVEDEKSCKAGKKSKAGNAKKHSPKQSSKRRSRR